METETETETAAECREEKETELRQRVQREAVRDRILEGGGWSHRLSTKSF